MMPISCVLLALLLVSPVSGAILAQPLQEESAPSRESIPSQEPVELQDVSQQEEPTQPEQESSQETAAGAQQVPEPEAEEAEQPQEGAEAEPPSVAESTAQPLSQASSPGLVFQFNNVPLTTVIDSVMRELGYSYITYPGVSGSASIHTMGEIPREQAFEILEQLLKMNGQGIVKQDDMYFIIPLGESTRIPQDLILNPQTPVAPTQEETPPTQEQTPAAPGAESEPAGQSALEVPAQVQPVVSTIGAPQEEDQGENQQQEGVVTYIIPLHYVPSGDMVTLITPFVSNGASIINYATSNMLMITDFPSNIEQVLRLVQLLDTQYFDRTTVDLIPVRYNQASEIAEDLAQIFAPGSPAGVRIVTIERLNSLLVVTQAASVFQEVVDWVEKLDTATVGTNLKTFVYQVENNTAVNIAEILSQLYQDGFGLPSSGQGQATEGQQPAQPAQPTAAAPAQGASSIFRGSELGPSLQGRPLSSQSQTRAVVGGNVKIIVNEFNNSLIIQATEADYQFLLQTIRQLDVLPRQVLIEAKLYSVELRDDLSFGVSAFLEARDAAAAGPATTGQISPTGALSLMTRTFIGSSRQLESTITALRSKTNVEILEAPRILALDGIEAQINIGAEVPVTTASFGDPLQGGNQNNFINSIQFRPTGVTLLILPRISASGVVTMDLAIEVSSATGAALTPTINRNFVTTSLIVRDGQTVAMAGIMSDQTDITRDRVPILGDIPILGALFGQTVRTKRKSELIFFITPHVIHNLPTATELTLDFKRALSKAYDFIDKTDREERDLIQKRRDQELQNQ